MKLNLRFIPLASAVLVAVGLAGCAATPTQSDAHVHSDGDGKAGMAMGGMGKGGMDMQGHCEMHQKMMSGKSSAEQHAMMQEHLKSMTPEMRQRMQGMHEQCKPKT